MSAASYAQTRPPFDVRGVIVESLKSRVVFNDEDAPAAPPSS